MSATNPPPELPLLPVIECRVLTDRDVDAACQGKLPWPSPRVGTNAAYAHAWRLGLKAPPESWALYQCPKCDALHLTTHARPGEVRRALAAAASPPAR